MCATMILFCVNSNNVYDLGSYHFHINSIQGQSICIHTNTYAHTYVNTHNVTHKHMPPHITIHIHTSMYITIMFTFVLQGTYNPQLYKQWMGSFLNLTNPVIAYMEAGYVAYFRQLRSHMPKHLTVVHTVNKEEMWAFSLKHRTAEVFHNQHVPASHPNNVIPAYSCAMHAKYELMLRSILENPHKTKYFAWQDIGLFRDLVHTNHNRPIRIDPYRIELPHRFNHNKVAYTAVHKLNRNLSLRNIFEKDVVWLCGCFFIGHASKIAEWSQDYMRAVEWLLRVGLMSTDQQVIVAMHSKESEVESIVQIQSYSSHGSEYNPWFYLGYLCRESGFYVLKKREKEKIQQPSQNLE